MKNISGIGQPLLSFFMALSNLVFKYVKSGPVEPEMSSI